MLMEARRREKNDSTSGFVGNERKKGGGMDLRDSEQIPGRAPAVISMCCYTEANCVRPFKGTLPCHCFGLPQILDGFQVWTQPGPVINVVIVHCPIFQDHFSDMFQITTMLESPKVTKRGFLQMFNSVGHINLVLTQVHMKNASSWYQQGR